MNGRVYKTTSDVPPDWCIGDLIIDTYEVKAVHEGGGMGKVYRCHSLNWNMDLAVKSPRADLFQTEAQKENFTHECETWIMLGLHSHIVTCFYVRQLGGIPRVFAEYIEGGSLKEWIDDGKLYGGGKTDALVRIIDIAIQTAIGLNYAHEKKLIHQDVKSANILMTVEGCAKVADFGLSNARTSVEIGNKKDDSTRSILCSFGGRTPAYNSPEQAHGYPLTRRTDIYSWAVTVLEMFVGGIRWTDGRVAREVLFYLQEGSLDSVPKCCPQIPDSMATLLSQCLMKDEKLRPHGFEEVTNSLVKIYEQLTKTAYQCSDTDPVELDGDTLNNRMLSLLEMGRVFEPPIQNAYKILLNLEAKHTDHYLGRLNKALFHWRVTGTSIERLNREVDSIFTDPYAPDILEWRIRLEFEKFDYMRARKLLQHCPDIQSKKVTALSCEEKTLRASVKSVLTDVFSSHQGTEAKQIEGAITFADERENVQFSFAHRRTGFVAIISRSVVNGRYCSYRIVGYDYWNKIVLWEQPFERSVTHVGVSENARLVAVACYAPENDTTNYNDKKVDDVCTLTILSAVNGEVLAVDKRTVQSDCRSWRSENRISSITLDDSGSRISIWIYWGDKIYELPYQFLGNHLEQYRCDLRKEPEIGIGTTFRVDVTGEYLACFTENKCSLWKYLDTKSDNKTNVFCVSMEDFGLIDSTGHLIGFELERGFEYAIDDLNRWDLLNLLKSYRPRVKAEYLLSRPMDATSAWHIRVKSEELRTLASHEIRNDNILNAISCLTNYLSISSEDRDEVLSQRHALVLKAGRYTLARVWMVSCWDMYWDRQIMGLLPICDAGKFVVQSQASFRMASMRGERMKHDEEETWIDFANRGDFTIGMFRINDGRHIRLKSRQDHSGYMKSGCRIELVHIGKDMKNVESFWSHEINWGRQDTVSGLMAVVDDAIVFEGTESVILICSLLTGEIRRSVQCTRGRSARFIKRVALPSGLVLAFVALAPRGYMLVGPTGDTFAYCDLGYLEPKLQYYHDISADGLCLVGGYGNKDWSLFHEKLSTGDIGLVWSIAGLPIGSCCWSTFFDIHISPCGRAVVFCHFGILQVYDVQTRMNVFSWGIHGNRVIDIAFDASSEWLMLARDDTRLEVFRLFWAPSEIDWHKTKSASNKVGNL